MSETAQKVVLLTGNIHKFAKASKKNKYERLDGCVDLAYPSTQQKVWTILHLFLSRNHPSTEKQKDVTIHYVC